MFSFWYRDASTCPENQNYYRCSSVSYSGCCTHDPCSSGVCEDTPDSHSDLCGAGITVTVTQTILQGAATSTINTATSSSGMTTGEPDVNPPNQSSLIPSSGGTSSMPPSLQASSIPSRFIPSNTTGATVGPGTTKTIHLVPATPGSTANITASASSSKCPKPTASTTANSTPPPPATIAGSVIGSMAGLALIVSLLVWCCRRKRKITFKRKVQKTDQEEQSNELRSVKEERDQALWCLEQNKTLPSPRPVDFGLPQVPKNSGPVMPQQWI
ncbi:uncharacterized protein A1O5_02697 [Cladophialophora psammophila CBS 110553]|uniref:Uncharacterized protein n=1 Tax=Cladophialophora psammophila CBS 110553 TaxID=1182543 RepID=W9XBW6_9EURO|nr:uncharacterized protein A1O5_02697 [Cladophialophora psammophila CBS 110553]EXJ74401.1 hypothetical protein A1O5_02697 [Cladophialophora psammophila CBS 110553]